MKTFVIYAGRYQIFHLGHKSVYDWLVSKFGVDSVYISTTGVTDSVKSPFSFEEKKRMMEVSGVPTDKILLVKNNYNLSTVVDQIPIDINKDAIFFTVSQKDMSDDPRFGNFTKKDGTPTYLQSLPKDPKTIKPAVEHGYLLVAPTKTFKILGKDVTSASELRNTFSTLSPEDKVKFVTQLFGRFDQGILNIMNQKLTLKESKGVQRLIDKVIRKILKEDFDSDIRSLTKRRDLLDYEIEKIKLKKAVESQKRQQDNLKKISVEGGDVDAAKKQLDLAKQEVDSAKKRLISAGVKKSA